MHIGVNVLAIKTTQIFGYLNKLGLADQVHFYDGEEIIFYHWNRAISDLILSVSIKNGLIERIDYPRMVIPLIYKMVNTKIENDLNTEEYKFTRDKRSEGERNENTIRDKRDEK